jgi:hypothetical protein
MGLEFIQTGIVNLKRKRFYIFHFKFTNRSKFVKDVIKLIILSI